MRAATAHTFVGDLMAALLVMQVEDLPDPISVSWHRGYGTRPCLWVQVQEEHFRAWLHQLQDPELHTDPDAEDPQQELHLHAEGFLTDAPTARVHVVTVTTLDTALED